MKSTAGPLAVISLLLVGAGFVVAALGALSPVGIQSSPLQWAFGVAGLLGGRMLLAASLRETRPPIVVDATTVLQAVGEPLGPTPTQTQDSLRA
jgi:hypothetical protein